MAATEQDVLRLVAEAVDNASPTFKKLQKTIHEFGKDSRDEHKRAAKEAKDHAEKLKALHERMSKAADVMSGALAPAFAAVGIAGFSLGAVFDALGDKIKEASEAYEVFNGAVQRSGMSAAKVDTWVHTFERLGLTSQQAIHGASKLGETLDMLNRPTNSAERQRLTDLFQNAVPYLDKIREGAKDRADEIKKIFEAIGNQNIPLDIREKLAEGLGAPRDLALKSSKEIAEAYRKSLEEELKHPINMPLLKQLNEAFTNLQIASDDFWRDIVNTWGPAAIKAIDGVNKGLSTLTTDLQQEYKDLVAIEGVLSNIVGFDDKMRDWFQGKLGVTTDPFAQPGKFLHDLNKPKHMGASPDAFGNWSLAQKLAAGMSPVSFTTGGANGPQKIIRDGTHDGVIDAFRELMGFKSSTGQPTFQHASYEGVDNGGGAGGYGNGVGGYRGSGVGGGQAPQSMLSQGGNTPYPDVKGVLTGHSVQGGLFDRSRFAKELANNPALRDRVMRIASNEQGINPAGTQAVIESMMNRANVRGTSLAEQAKWYRLEKGGYYAPGSMGRGALENSHSRAILEHSLANALAGSNTIGYATDNSSAGLAEREAATGHFRRLAKIHGESFFAPGTAERGLAHKWDRMMEQETARAADRHGAHLADHIRHHLGGSSAKPGHLGHASISVDVNAPRGTKTGAKVSGLFKDVRINRGAAMPMASQDA